MTKLKKYKQTDPDPETVDERIVIYRDEPENPRTYSDHTFKLYSQHRDFVSDKNVEDPFEEDYDGCKYLKQGYVCFPVSVYEHSGYAFSIGDGSNFPDARWDVTRNKIWLYTNKELYESMYGKDSWKNTTKTILLKIAQSEIDELNLDADGHWYGWCHEKKITWTKTYNDKNKTVEQGHDWENIDGCGMYLTDKLQNIDYQPKNLPVYLQEDVYID